MCAVVGVTAIIFAAEGGHIECMRSLVEAGAEYQKGTRIYNETCLAVAARQGRDECIRYLMQLPNMEEAVSRADSHGDTPLMVLLKSVFAPSEQLVVEMLEHDLPCLVTDGSPKASYAFSWSFVLAIPTMNSNRCLSIVERIVNLTLLGSSPCRTIFLDARVST